MVNIDFDLVGIQSDVIQNIDVEFNVSNGTTSTVYPLPYLNGLPVIHYPKEVMFGKTMF
jgi:hypothetical protein